MKLSTSTELVNFLNGLNNEKVEGFSVSDIVTATEEVDITGSLPEEIAAHFALTKNPALDIVVFNMKKDNVGYTMLAVFSKVPDFETNEFKVVDCNVSLVKNNDTGEVTSCVLKNPIVALGLLSREAMKLKDTIQAQDTVAVLDNFKDKLKSNVENFKE